MTLWVLLGLATCHYALGLGVFGPSGPDSGFFPLVTGVVITASGAALMLLPGQRLQGGAPFFTGGAGSFGRVALVTAALIVMILLIPVLGFLLTGILVTPVLLRAVDGRSWTFCIAIGAVGAASIVLLFSFGLNVPLPRGPLGF